MTGVRATYRIIREFLSRFELHRRKLNNTIWDDGEQLRFEDEGTPTPFQLRNLISALSLLSLLVHLCMPDEPVQCIPPFFV